MEEEENVKDTTTADDLQPEVDPGVRANEIFDTKDNASESTKVNKPTHFIFSFCHKKLGNPDVI